MPSEPCAKCDGPGVTFDKDRGLIVACDRCHGKGLEPPARPGSAAPPRP